ncbi:MAG: YCF48-related protein [Myxococcales bacterium]
MGLSNLDRIRRQRVRLALVLVSWTVLAVGSARGEPVQRLSFRDRLYDATLHQSTLWVVGYPGILLRSEDGGASFSRVSVPTHEALFAIDFNEQGLGAIVGRSGTLLVSLDHGASWTLKLAQQAQAPDVPSEGTSAPPNAVSQQPAVHLFGVDVLENGTLVAVGDFGTVLRSQDRGESWQACEVATELTSGAVPDARRRDAEGELSGIGGASAETENEGEAARLSSVSFGDDTHGFIVGEFGWILASSDGGRSWRRQASGSDKLLFSVRARSPVTAIAVGSEGTVLETRDAGASWQARPHGESRHLFDVACQDARCAATGQEGLVMLWEGDGPPISLASEALAPLSAVAFAGRALVVAGKRGYVLRAAPGAHQLTRVLGE